MAAVELLSRSHDLAQQMVFVQTFMDSQMFKKVVFCFFCQHSSINVLTLLRNLNVYILVTNGQNSCRRRSPDMTEKLESGY